MTQSFAAVIALTSAALLTASPTRSFAAVAHQPAHKTAVGQDKVSAWLKLCDKDELQCENRLLKAPFANIKCIPEDDVDSYVLTPKIRAWFAAHPAHNSDPINRGINAALADLYPCAK